MKDDEAVKRILDLLDELYPWDESCFLEYRKPWQLLFATILSAQCTDDRVNAVTKTLYKKYRTLEAFASAEIDELEQDVLPAGFYKMKAKHIKETAELLISRHGGMVPGDIESLVRLPGVGRKTANVTLGHVFKIPSIVVDTHVKRISNRLGLTKNSCPVKIEFDLMKILPESHWIRFNQQIITHGRQVCVARSPRCEKCGLASECDARAADGRVQ